MEKDAHSTKFYVNEYILGIQAFLGIELIGALAYILSVPNPILFFLYLCTGIVFLNLIVTRFMVTRNPVIEISEKSFSFDEKTFDWAEIDRITLGPQRFARTFLPQLKVEWKKIPYFIKLRYVTDAERRHLLDEIEKYKPVQYIKCTYEGNYMF